MRFFVFPCLPSSAEAPVRREKTRCRPNGT